MAKSITGNLNYSSLFLQKKVEEAPARILEVPVATLLDPACLGTQPMVRGALSLDVPVFHVDDAVIWGATAMVLAEFLSLLGWPAKRP